MSGMTRIRMVYDLQTTKWPDALPSPKQDRYFFSVFCGSANSKTLRFAFHAPLSYGGKPLSFWSTDYLKPDMDSIEMLISLLSDSKTINILDFSPQDYIFGKGTKKPTYESLLSQACDRGIDETDRVKVYIVSDSSSSSTIKKASEPDLPPPRLSSQEQLIFKAFNQNMFSDIFLMKRSDFLDPQDEDTNKKMECMGVKNLAAVRGAKEIYKSPMFVLDIDNSPYIKCHCTDSEGNLIGFTTIENIHSALQSTRLVDSDGSDVWEALLDRLEKIERVAIRPNETTATYGESIGRSILEDSAATIEEAAMAGVLSLFCNCLQTLIDDWKEQIDIENSTPVICVTGCERSNGSGERGKKRMNVTEVILELLHPNMKKKEPAIDDNTVVFKNNKLVNVGIAEVLYLHSLKRETEMEGQQEGSSEAQHARTEIEKEG